jgi:hypothetical protein
MAVFGFLGLFYLSLYNANRGHKTLILKEFLRLDSVGLPVGEVYQ